MNKYVKYLKKIYCSEDFFGNNPNEVIFSHVIQFGDGFFYHSHKFYEIIYITEGNIKHIVNKEWLDLKLGDICFLRPNDLHMYIRNEEEKCAHRDLIIEKKFFEDACNWLSPTMLKLYHNPNLPHKISLTPDQIVNLEKQIKKINKCNFVDHEKKKTLAKAFVINLLSLLYNKISSTDIGNNSYPQLIHDILEVANINYARPIHDILKRFNYDKSYICRQFKKHVGMTMTDYVNNLRLNYVLSQLSLTRKNILDISYEAGFHSVSYLNHLFKKKYGITPTEYRKNREE